MERERDVSCDQVSTSMECSRKVRIGSFVDKLTEELRTAITWQSTSLICSNAQIDTNTKFACTRIGVNTYMHRRPRTHAYARTRTHTQCIKIQMQVQ